MKFLYIGAFGLAGVFSRYLVGHLATLFSLTRFPYATLTVNLLGAFLIGIAFVAGAERSAISDDLRIGLIVGFLGGFTTYSSLALESVLLYQDGRPVQAGLYLFLTNALGLLAVLLGHAVGRLMLGPR